jgi:hypothetical protein
MPAGGKENSPLQCNMLIINPPLKGLNDVTIVMNELDVHEDPLCISQPRRQALKQAQWYVSNICTHK